MIELHHISFSYGQKEVLHDITLSLRAGEFVGIIGPNGCGKTTLLRIAARLAPPKSGTCTLAGRDYTAFGKKEFARLVAHFPQTRPLPDLTVYDYVACARYPHTGLSGRLTATDRAAIDQALKKTDTATLAARTVRDLSGGERQRVYLALLLAQEADMLLLDEPIAHLDIGHALALTTILQQTCCMGKGVSVVFHDLALALSVSDRLVLMQDGKLLAENTPAGLVKSGKIEEVFGVRAYPVADDKTYAILPLEGK